MRDRRRSVAEKRLPTAALIDIIHNDTDLPEGGCSNCPLTRYLPLEGQVRLKRKTA